MFKRCSKLDSRHCVKFVHFVRSPQTGICGEWMYVRCSYPSLCVSVCSFIECNQHRRYTDETNHLFYKSNLGDCTHGAYIMFSFVIWNCCSITRMVVVLVQNENETKQKTAFVSRWYTNEFMFGVLLCTRVHCHTQTISIDNEENKIRKMFIILCEMRRTVRVNFIASRVTVRFGIWCASRCQSSRQQTLKIMNVQLDGWSARCMSLNAIHPLNVYRKWYFGFTVFRRVFTQLISFVDFHLLLLFHVRIALDLFALPSEKKTLEYIRNTVDSSWMLSTSSKFIQRRNSCVRIKSIADWMIGNTRDFQQKAENQTIDDWHTFRGVIRPEWYSI